MKQERVCTFIGWHDARNTGDDAMLLAILKAVSPCLPDFVFQVLSRSSSVTRNFRNVVQSPSLSGRLTHKFRRAFISRWKPGSNVWMMGEVANVAIFGGGNIFHSKSSISWKNAVVEAINKDGKSSFCAAIGVGFGEFYDETAEHEAIRFVKAMNVCIVRDQRSFDFASHHASDGALVLMGPDLALDTSAKIWETARYPRPHTKSAMLGRSLVLAPHGPLVRALGRAERRRFREELATFVAQNFATVGVLVSCADPIFGDFRESKTMLKKLRKHGVPARIIEYDGDPREMVRSVSENDFVLSQRLHPLVYANVSCQRIAAYGQVGEKVSGVLRQIGLEPVRLETSFGVLEEFVWSKNRTYKAALGELNTVLHQFTQAARSSHPRGSPAK